MHASTVTWELPADAIRRQDQAYKESAMASGRSVESNSRTTRCHSDACARYASPARTPAAPANGLGSSGRHEADRTGGQGAVGSRADAARVFTRVGARRELRSQFLENARGPRFYDLQYRGTCVQAKHTRASKRKHDVMQNGRSSRYLFFAAPAGRRRERPLSAPSSVVSAWRTALKRTDATHGAVFSCRVG